MAKFDLIGALKTIAPTLAALLGGPLAGTAVSALESAFGLAPGAGMDGITSVVQTGAMTPEIMAAVRAADQKHAEIIAQQKTDIEKINKDFQTAMAGLDTSDRASARQREVAVKDNTNRNLAYFYTAGYFGLMATVIKLGISPEVKDIVIALIGILSAAELAIMNYYFGSSSGSAAKTDVMAKAMNGNK